MKNNRINKRIYNWALHKARGNCKNSLFKVLKFFSDYGLGIDVENLSNGWCKNEILPKIETILEEQFKSKWYNDINSEQGPSKKGKNKLRLYKLFKEQFETESYVSNNMPRSHRSALAKFRSGTAPIRIETGRYENIPLCDRVCIYCDKDEIEDEFHVIMSCSFYSDIRENLFKWITQDAGKIDFNILSQFEQFISMFSSSDVNMNRKLAKTCHDILKRRRYFNFV